MTDLLSFDDAEQLIQNVNAGLRKIQRELARLHKGRAWEALGYNSWSELLEQRIDHVSRRSVYYYLKQAEGIERLEAVGVQDAARESGAALEAFAAVPANMARSVYAIASEDGTAKLTANRVNDALACVDTMLKTGAVEDENGDMRPVFDTLMGNVRMAAGLRKSARDDCRWIVSREPVLVRYATMTPTDDIRAELYFNCGFDKLRQLYQTLRDLDGQHVVISIGVQHENV